MKFFTYLTVLFFTTFCYSQTDEYAGYYVTANGQKVEGYFKNSDFSNPNSLEFKKSASGDYTRLSPDEINEYGIGTSFRFIKQTVKVDKSDNTNMRMLSSVKDPQFVTETLFLNVLVDGAKASLYSANFNKSTRFFYNLEDKTQFTQLVFKKYEQVEGTVSTNNFYQQQLFKDLNCKGESIDKFLNTKYDQKQLVKIFTDFNTCSGSQFAAYNNEGGKKVKVLYSVFGGIYNSKFSIEEQRLPRTSGTGMSYGLGAEIALVVPSGRWEFFVRGEYEIYKVESVGTFRTTYNEQVTAAEIDAKAINFFIGPRYNFILNDKNKIFIDGAVGLSLASGDVNTEVTIKPFSSEAYTRESVSYPISNSAFLNFGAGYTFNNKFGIRVMLETNRNVFDNINIHQYSADVSRIGVNLIYTIN